MSVYRHKRSPCWQFDFIIAGYRFTGSTEIPAKRPKREAEAVEKAERRAAEQLIEEVRQSGRAPMTLAVAVDRWWEEVAQHGSETDIKPWLEWLRDQIGPNKKLHEINSSDVTKAVNERRKHLTKAGKAADGKQLYRPITNRTVNRSVPLLLRRIMRRARDAWSVVIFNEPKWKNHILPEKKRPIEEITLAKEERLDELERPEYQRFRRFATIHGLRARECLLTWPQVDFEAAEFRIIAKGGVPHVIPMTKDSYAILWGERGRHETYVFTFVAQRTRRCAKSGREFVKGERYPITYSGMSSNRVRHWKRAGVVSRFHDTRHTCGRRTLRATGNLKLTQRVLRHADIGITSRLYADVDFEDIRTGMEATALDVESRKKSRTEQQPPAKALKD